MKSTHWGDGKGVNFGRKAPPLQKLRVTQVSLILYKIKEKTPLNKVSKGNITQMCSITIWVICHCLCHFVLVGMAISPHHSDQMAQRSKVSRIAPEGCSLSRYIGRIECVWGWKSKMLTFPAVTNALIIEDRTQVKGQFECFSGYKGQSSASQVHFHRRNFDVTLLRNTFRGKILYSPNPNCLVKMSYLMSAFLN